MDKKFLSIFTAAMVISFVGCDKNELGLNDNVNQPNVQKISNSPGNVDLRQIKVDEGLLVFSSFEEFEDVMKQASELTDVERQKWEESIGFQSFGRKCDEFYSHIDFDKFNSDKEISAFIETHADILSLEMDGDSAAAISVHYIELPERCIMNADRMYIIEGTVYKHFPDNIEVAAEATAENVKTLKTSADTDLEKLKRMPNIEVYEATINKIIYAPSQPQQPSNALHDSGWLTRYSSNGNYRDKIRLFTQIMGKPVSGYNVYYTRTGYEMLNEHHKRFLGFLWWYWADESRYISGSVNINNIYCFYNFDNGQYYTNTSYNIFNLNRWIKHETNCNDLTIQKYNPSAGAKPWSYISKYAVIYTVDNIGMVQWYYN
ncbi:MAG: hypothetical protein FWD66_08840 [Paludibacter sp.]|nr:hypothetical protein [Paludibacter sp.]